MSSVAEILSIYEKLVDDDHHVFADYLHKTWVAEVLA